jgi:hypothetical protein
MIKKYGVGEVDKDLKVGMKVVSLDAVLDLIDKWYSDNFYNTVVSQDTRVINHTLAAKEDLKQRLTAL